MHTTCLTTGLAAPIVSKASQSYAQPLQLNKSRLPNILLSLSLAWEPDSTYVGFRDPPIDIELSFAIIYYHEQKNQGTTFSKEVAFS